MISRLTSLPNPIFLIQPETVPKHKFQHKPPCTNDQSKRDNHFSDGGTSYCPQCWLSGKKAKHTPYNTADYRPNRTSSRDQLCLIVEEKVRTKSV
jgi:hypothetical protein